MVKLCLSLSSSLDVVSPLSVCCEGVPQRDFNFLPEKIVLCTAADLLCSWEKVSQISFSITAFDQNLPLFLLSKFLSSSISLMRIRNCRPGSWRYHLGGSGTYIFSLNVLPFLFPLLCSNHQLTALKRACACLLPYRDSKAGRGKGESCFCFSWSWEEGQNPKGWGRWRQV